MSKVCFPNLILMDINQQNTNIFKVCIMNLKNLRCWEYLGKLIVEIHEGYEKAGTTFSGTELELWLELPSTHYCTWRLAIFSKKYFVITRWWNRDKKRDRFCAIHCIWPRIQTILISNQNIFKHRKLFPDPETWDNIDQIPCSICWVPQN